MDAKKQQELEASAALGETSLWIEALLAEARPASLICPQTSEDRS